MSTKKTEVAPAPTSIADVATAELQARRDRINALLDQVDEEMADAVELTDEARLHASRLRTGEEEALAGVLDYADAVPELFKNLANKDEGKDPKVFETGLVRQRLAAGAILQSLTDRIDATRLSISDSALYVATLAKPPALAAYEIAKPQAQHDPVHGKHLNAAINLYTRVAKAGAATRKAKKPQPPAK